MTVESNLFEIERRTILFHRDTSMPDATQLGYIGDPNLANPANTDGEFLLFWSPAGTRFLDKTALPYVLWEKVRNGGEAAAWVVSGTGSGGGIGSTPDFKLDGGPFIQLPPNGYYELDGGSFV